jgi:hypothetical protein
MVPRNLGGEEYNGAYEASIRFPVQEGRITIFEHPFVPRK